MALSDPASSNDTPQANAAAERSEPAEARPGTDQARKRPRVAAWFKDIATYGALTAGAIVANSFEAAHFSREYAVDTRSADSTVKLTGRTFGVFIDDPITLLPELVVRELQAIAQYDPLVSTALDAGVTLAIASPYEWTDEPNRAGILLEDGRWRINGGLLYATLDGTDPLTTYLDDAGRAKSAAVKLAPFIATSLYHRHLETVIHRADLPVDVIESAEFTACRVVREAVARSIGRAQAGDIFFSKSIPADHRDFISVSSAHSTLVDTWSVAAVTEMLVAHWGKPRAETVVPRDQIPTLHAIIAAEAKNTDIIAGFAQRAEVETTVHRIIETRDDARRLVSLAGLSPFSTADLPTHPSEHDTLLLAQRLGNVRYAQQPLTPAERSAIETIMARAFEDWSRDLNRLFHPDVRGPTYARSFVDLRTELATAEGMLRLHAALPELAGGADRSAAILTRLGEVATVCAESLDAIPGSESGFALNYLHPAYCETIRVLERWRGLANESLARHKAEATRFLTRCRPTDGSTSLETTLGRETLLLLTPNERRWLDFIFRFGEHRYAPPGSQPGTDPTPLSAGLADWCGGHQFELLTPTARAAWLRTCLPGDDDLPRTRIYTDGLTIPLPLGGFDLREEVLARTYHSRELTPLEASLVVEATCSLPTIERTITTTPPWSRHDIERHLMRAIGTPPSEPGPLAVRIAHLLETPPYAELAPTKTLPRLIAAVFPEAAWSPNVTIYSSSRADEYTFSFPWSGSYGHDLIAGLRAGRSLDEAHDAAAADRAAERIHISHLTRWLTTLIFREPAPVGVFRHTPDRSGLPASTYAPSHALIVYGDNLGRDIVPLLRYSAAESKAVLETRFGTRCVTSNPASSAELEGALRTLLSDKSAPGGELTLILLGHGDAAPASGHGFEFAPRGSHAARDLGAILLRSGYVLTEDKLKTLVNQELAHRFDRISIVVFSCHAGAWLK